MLLRRQLLVLGLVLRRLWPLLHLLPLQLLWPLLQLLLLLLLLLRAIAAAPSTHGCTRPVVG